MNSSPLEAHDASNDRVLEAVSNAARRAVLLELRDRAQPVDVETLALAISARLEEVPSGDGDEPDGELDGEQGGELDDEQGGELDGEPDCERDGDRTAADTSETMLRAVHLPKLADVGLLEWDEERGRVTAADHHAFRDHRFLRLLAVDTEGWDAVLEALSDARRRLVLTVLQGTEEELDRRRLARQMLARERGDPPTRVPAEAVRSVLVSLHHVHLPVLQRAGLLAYDGDSACYIGHPELDDDWLIVEPETLHGSHDVTGRGTLSGP